MPPKISTFAFTAGRKVGPRYVIESKLGGGSEGEVYKIRELDTSIHRAAKFYFPHRDPKHKLSIKHAQKLNALRHCSIVLQYHHSEIILVKGQRIVALISDLAEGEQLEGWIAKHHGGRLQPYVALHVLYNLVRGLEAVHALGLYHADVHSQNILIKPTGVRFDLKLVDFYDWGPPKPYKQKQDIKDTLRVFHECLGGAKHYHGLPEEVKYICAGLKRELMLSRFPTMTALRRHLEEFEWSSVF
jgi:serine/threonine protein kinase